MKTSLKAGLLVCAALAFALLPSMPANPPDAGQKPIKEPHHVGRVVVKFKPEVAAGKREEVHGKAQTRLLRRFNRLHGIEVREVAKTKSVKDAIREYEASGLVEYAEPDFAVTANLSPNDPQFTSGAQWDMYNTGQSGGTIDADIDGPEGWNVRTSASSVIVATVDTGVRFTHEDLAANIWKNPGEIAGNTKDDDADGYVDDLYGINAIKNNGNPSDDNGHGTHVAGTIGAVGNNGKGVAGVAWNVKLMACKFLDSTGSGYTSDAIECIDFAAKHGAQIINNSWGGGGYSQSLYDAISQLRAAGIIFVVAAGNEHANNDTTPSYPASYNLDNIVAVAAIDRYDALASYSNYGPNTVLVAAPGSSIVSTYNSSDSSYSTLSGTSMAAPHVAGLLALLKAQYPTATYKQLIQIMMSCVDPIPSLTGKVKSGGCINLYRALANLPAPPPNNDFSSATVASGDSFTVTGANRNATKEAGEPLHAGNSGGASVWWKWTSKANGPVKVTTSGSDFNTLLGVYVGSSVSNLGIVASNDDAPNVQTSALTFTATAGTTYYFALDGLNGATGAITLAVTGPSSGTANDYFANRTVLTTSSFATTGLNVGATRENGEPNIAGVPGGKSVWWSWKAPASGSYVIDTFYSNFDTTLGVYTGTSVSALTKIAGNDDADAYTRRSKVAFQAVAGITYQIAVDGYYGDSGAIRLEGYYK